MLNCAHCNKPVDYDDAKLCRRCDGPVHAACNTTENCGKLPCS